MNSAPKSSASRSCRISIPDSTGIGFGQRFTHSTASSIDFTCHSQKPATSSLVSANGPSITVRFLPANRTRLPFDVGCNPSPASMMPALTNSSLKWPIAVRIVSSGIAPASDAHVALTITISCLVGAPSGREITTVDPAPDGGADPGPLDMPN